jgi:hypothetical protein
VSPARRLLLKALVVGVCAFVLGATFTAYLQPALLTELANLLLCY